MLVIKEKALTFTCCKRGSFKSVPVNLILCRFLDWFFCVSLSIKLIVVSAMVLIDNNVFSPCNRRVIAF